MQVGQSLVILSPNLVLRTINDMVHRWEVLPPALNLIFGIFRQNGDEILSEMVWRHVCRVLALSLKPFSNMGIQVFNVLALRPSMDRSDALQMDKHAAAFMCEIQPTP